MHFLWQYRATNTDIWPEWLGRLLPFGDAHEVSHIRRTSPNAVEDHHTTDFHRRRQGGVFSLKPFIACKGCNTGWMALFEDEMVKFSKPLFTTRDPDQLDEYQIRVFSVWLSLIVILAENFFRDNITIPHSDLDFLRRRRLPPEKSEYFLRLVGCGTLEAKLPTPLSHNTRTKRYPRLTNRIHDAQYANHVAWHGQALCPSLYLSG